MARTVDEIKKEMIDNYFGNEVVRRAYGLEEGKAYVKVGITSVLFYSVAFAIWVLEKFVEREREEIEEIVNTKMYGTIGWWHGKVLAWQDGDMTIVKDGTVGYEIVDEGKRKVAKAAIVAKDRQINIKVAKMGNEWLAPLETDERRRLESYVEDVKPAGLVASVVSLSPDELAMELWVWYDGELAEMPVVESVKSAVNDYLRGVEFDGTIYANKIMDAVRAKAGVNDCDIISLVAVSPTDGAKTDITRGYAPVSGYCKVTNTNIKMIAE